MKDIIDNIFNVEGGFTKVIDTETKIKENDMIKVVIYLKLFYSNQTSRRSLIKEISKKGFYRNNDRSFEDTDIYKNIFYIDFNINNNQN